MRPDGVHPNEQGYPAIKQQWSPYLPSRSRRERERMAGTVAVRGATRGALVGGRRFGYPRRGGAEVRASKRRFSHA